jgi:trans-aconitate methyltransferase
VLFDQADGYERSSTTQRHQGIRLLDVLDVPDVGRVLDVGCGNGLVTLDLAQRFATSRVDGIDVSAEMIRLAQGHLTDDLRDRVTFEVADILVFDPAQPYDLVFSNSSMHWVLPADQAYKQLFKTLVRGGRLAVHQGGSGCYRGLWQCAVEVIESMGLGSYYANWTYPVFYPTAAEMEELLQQAGFVDVLVESVESNGSELTTLYRDFAYAGLLPFLRRLPEAKQEAFRSEFLHHADRTAPDRYTHRLFVQARRP